MPDFSGPVQPVVVSRALVVLLLAPVATAVVHFAKSTNAPPKTAGDDKRDQRGKRGKRDERETWIRNGALVTALLAVGALVALLAQPASDRFFVQHLFRWLRSGELDANFDLACDPTSALVLLGAAGLAAAGAKSTKVNAAALLSAAALVILSGDLLGMTIGLVLVAVLASPLLKAPASRLAFASVATMTVATALLFWGTGGAWHPDGYGSDFRARLAAVAVTSPGASPDTKEPAARGQGLLTITAYPGSPIFLDDSRTALERNGGHLDTPFSRLPLPAGVHSFRVHPGLGEDDQLVVRQAMGDGRELALVPIGSTLSPRALADEMALVDANGATSWRDVYLGRALVGTLRVAAVTAWAFVLVAISFGASSAWTAWAARKSGGLARHDAMLIAVAGASGAVVLLRLRASLALASSPALITAAIVIALVLAAAPLAVAKKLAAKNEAADGAASGADDTWFAAFAAFARRVAHLSSLSPASSVASAPGASRAVTVDAVFGAFVLLFLLALVFAR